MGIHTGIRTATLKIMGMTMIMDMITAMRRQAACMITASGPATMSF